MAWILAIVSLVSALLPLADRGMQMAQQRAVTAYRPVSPAVSVPPEAGQPGIVFHQGHWWKWDGRQWWIWRPAASNTGAQP